jgi:multidrug resistance protein
LLAALNFLNYIDRSILFSVQPLLQREFALRDLETGYITTAFILCYMVAAPPLGYLADRVARRPIIVTGAIVWSVSTLLTAVTHDYHTLLLRHCLVGIGEASFVAAAPSLIADLYPEERRGRMLAVFFMGIPTGTALGYVIGAVLGNAYGWRAPFYVVAAPGVALALLLLRFPEPRRGAQDPATSRSPAALCSLGRNPAYLTATLGMAMMTFALGGLQVWMPTFLVRVRGMHLLHANLFFAAITVVNGVAATLAGGWLGDRMMRRRRDAYFYFSGLTLLLAAPLLAGTIYLDRPALFPLCFLTEFLLLLNTGPLNAAVIDAVPAGIRASAVALNVLVIHLLGDALSPAVLGYVSDRTGSLQTAFLAALAAVVVSAVVLLSARCFAPQLRGAAPAPGALGPAAEA